MRVMHHPIFVTAHRTCALKLFSSNQYFHIVPTLFRPLLTVENETKETDNDSKTAVTATTDAHALVSERV